MTNTVIQVPNKSQDIYLINQQLNALSNESTWIKVWHLKEPPKCYINPWHFQNCLREMSYNVFLIQIQLGASSMWPNLIKDKIEKLKCTCKQHQGFICNVIIRCRIFLFRISCPWNVYYSKGETKYLLKQNVMQSLFNI